MSETETRSRAGRNTPRLGRHFPRFFLATVVQEIGSAMLLHLPGYFTAQGATEGAIGMLYGMGAVLALAIRPALGRLLDLRQRRSILLIALMINIVLLLCMALGLPWGPSLWVVVLAQRITWVIGFMAMLTYGAEMMPPQHRTSGLAIFGLAGLTSIATGGILADLLVPRLGFTGMFAFAATLSFLAMMIIRTLPVLEVKAGEPRRSFWATSAQGSLRPLWLASLTFSIGLIAVFTFGRTFVDSRQVGTAGLFFASYGLSAVATRIVGARLFDRASNRLLLAGSLVLYGIGLVLIGFADSVPVLIAGASATGIAHGSIFPVLTAEVLNRTRMSERGSAVTAQSLIGDVALLSAAPLVGQVIERFDYLVAFSATGVAVLAGALVYGAWDSGTDPKLLVPEEIRE